jgi:hypothetical protein
MYIWSRHGRGVSCRGHVCLVICLTLISNTANYIIVILDNSLVFRVTIPDAVLIQFDLLRMSKILLETCTCTGL